MVTLLYNSQTFKLTSLFWLLELYIIIRAMVQWGNGSPKRQKDISHLPLGSVLTCKKAKMSLMVELVNKRTKLKSKKAT